MNLEDIEEAFPKEIMSKQSWSYPAKGAGAVKQGSSQRGELDQLVVLQVAGRM